VTISLAVAVIITDATIVNVAIPSIVRDLQISTTEAEWITSVYSLVFAALLITVGRLGDQFGRRRLLLVGTLVFVGASVLCALADSGPLLIAARVLQGIGGAMLLPSTLSTLNATFSGRERAIAFAVCGSTIGGMAAIGPLLGGWLTTSFSWLWAFGINVFVGAVIIAGLLAYVRETKEEGARRGIDLPGTVLSAVGLGGLVFCLIEGQRYGWLRASDRAREELDRGLTVSPIVPVAVLAVIAVAAFVAVERRRQADGRIVVLDLALFSVPSFRNGNIAAMVISLGEFGLLFLLPLFLQNILGLSATRTGAVLVALAVGSFLAAPSAPGRRPGGQVGSGLGHPEHVSPGRIGVRGGHRRRRPGDDAHLGGDRPARRGRDPPRTGGSAGLGDHLECRGGDQCAARQPGAAGHHGGRARGGLRPGHPPGRARGRGSGAARPARLVESRLRPPPARWG